MSINAREYWSGSTQWTIHRNWQRRSHKTKNKNQTKTQKTNKMCVGHYYPKTNTDNVNKTWALLQTTGGKDEPTIVCMRKHNTEPKTSRHIIGEHKALQRWATRILMTGKSFVKALHLWVQSVFINIDGNLTALFNQIKTNLKKC
jgi:hypothetical protein